MLVLHAIDEARRARQMLNTAGYTSFLKRLEYEQRLLGHLFYGKELKPARRNLYAYLGYVGEAVAKLSDPESLKAEADSYSYPLQDALQHLIAASHSLKDTYLATSYKELEALDLSEVLGHELHAQVLLNGLYKAYSEVIGIIEAWEALADGYGFNQQALVLRFEGEALTLPQSIAWLTYLQGVVEFSFAANGKFEYAAAVRLERLETGSLWQSLIDVPEEVLKEISAFLKRGFNKRKYDAESALVETEGIEKMLDVFERLHQMVKDETLTPAQAESIQRKLMAKNDLPFWDSVTVIEVNGEVVASVTAPRQSRELPAGREDSDRE